MPGLVLVTGGTGAIGTPLVRALVRDGVPVVALARQPAAADCDAEMIRGDILAGATLGIESVAAAGLRQRVTTIIHAAALTRFDADPDEARRVNVDGTQNVLTFAEGCPKLRRICALSTVYVAGRRSGTILESELPHDAGFVNPYEASKYQAELLLREWMPRLPIAVCRLSTALGDSVTGQVDRPAAIHQAMRFLYGGLLPMIPGTPASPVDLIATDYAVHGIRHFAGDGFVPGRTFHLCAGDAAPAEQELIDTVIAAFVEHRPAWRRRTIERPAIVPLETFELFRASVEAVADSALRATVAVLGHFAPQLAYPKTFDDSGCRAALCAAGIERPAVGDTVRAVVKYLIEHNWQLRPSGQATSA